MNIAVETMAFAGEPAQVLQRSHLDWLESEAIYILREVAGECANPALLFSGGKDSAVLLRLAEKAFRPARFPFPLLHIDTGHNFPEVIEFRDARAAALDERLIVRSLEDSIRSGRIRLKHADESRNAYQSVTLLDTVAEFGFDALIGGARRDEEKARAKERVFSFRDSFGQWDPRNQRPELWDLYNAHVHPGEHVRVFPISNWTEMDVWQYIAREEITLPSVYYAHRRPVVRRKGLLVPVTPLTPPRAGEVIEEVSVRFRTVGDIPCTCPVESTAATAAQIIVETAISRVTERGATRMDDQTSDASMERRKKRGLFLMSLLGEIEKLDAPGALTALGERGVLRFITAGSVDDGKSTLIGRLLHDTHAIMEDQFSAVTRASIRRGALEPDLSLLTDGLEAEREQGITIDVAYRYFATPRRKFIIADTPGHEQYTRNMVTGASTADAAIILLDATKGVLAQSKRHLLIAYLLGISDVIVAVNKMDSVDYDQHVFESVKTEFLSFAAPLTITRMHFIPMSALRGDMVVDRGDPLGWYSGPTLLEHLESIEPASASAAVTSALRFPVQLVNRGGSVRGYAGRIAAGKVMIGDEIVVLPSGRRTRIRGVHAPDGERAIAVAGESVTLTLADDLDIARGNMLAAVDSPPRTETRIAAILCWLSEESLRPNARYVLRHTTRKVKAKILAVNDHLDIHTLQKRAHEGALQMNDIAGVTLVLQQPVFADAYNAVRATGAFILIDEATNQTIAAGMIK